MKEFAQLVWKRLPILISLTVIGFLLSGLITVLIIKPVFESASSVYVLSNKTSSESAAYNELLASQLLVNDCREIIKSRTLLGQVVEDLQGENINNVNVDDIAPMVAIRSKNDTRVIEILVDGTDRDLVYKINNSLTKRFVAGAASQFKLDNISVVDDSSFPLKPVSPNLILNLFLGLFLGFGISLLIVFSVEYFDTSIKSTEDVEKYLELPVIGKVPTVE
jgi:capsular polysaccharide biosynthesis protein